MVQGIGGKQGAGHTIVERAGFGEKETLDALVSAIALALKEGRTIVSDAELIDCKTRQILTSYEVRSEGGSVTLGSLTRPSRPVRAFTANLVFPFIGRVEVS